MKAVTTLVPVFTMIFLGFLANRKQWLNAEHTKGAKSLVFDILFPILIFNILFTTKLPNGALSLLAYVTAAFILCYGVGKLAANWVGKEYSVVTPFMLVTCEGGNVALPLYLTLVSAVYASNTVTFDISGTIIAFIAVPIMVAKKTASGGQAKDIIKAIVTNPFIIAVFLGLVLNLSGFYSWFSQSIFMEVYSETVSMITNPIVGIILFTIGYEMTVSKDSLAPLAKLVVLRVVLYTVVIAGFFILFPAMMQQREFMLAVILYFMCPTGFALPMQLSPLCTDKKQEAFMSSFISVFMIITLIVYTVLVIFF